MADIDDALFAALLSRDMGKAQLAMDRVHDGAGFTMALSFILKTNPTKPPTEAIADYLAAINGIDQYIGALRALGEEIAADGASLDHIVAIKDHSLDPDAFAAFLTESKAFRCRILVNGTVKGSGVLVSYRLILTAWHVINRPQPWDQDHPPLIEVETSDNQRFPAVPADPSSPCHDSEWDGKMPEDIDLIGHDDFALLRLTHPVGFSLGFAKPKIPPSAWQDDCSCYLVHFPLGQNAGVTAGTANFGANARRYWHTARSAKGSSGGALFSNRCEFLGIHQKAYAAKRKRYFVPASNFAKDETAELVTALRKDRTPSYLWSLDGSLDSPIVIGRRKLFDTLDHILDDTIAGTDRLRGIWIRRKRADEDQSGMGFGFDLLKAFLARRQPDSRLIRTALQSGELDVFALLQAAFGLTPQTDANPGVRVDETTAVAHDGDRAKALVHQIEQTATTPIWLYIDGPLQDLGGLALRQWEQIVTHLVRSPNVRFVLTRMESHSLPLIPFDSLSDIGPNGAPGVMYEYAGDFTLEDVATTLRAAGYDLGLGLSDNRVQDLAKDAVAGIDSSHGFYPASRLRDVGETVRGQLKREMER